MVTNFMSQDVLTLLPTFTERSISFGNHQGAIVICNSLFTCIDSWIFSFSFFLFDPHNSNDFGLPCADGPVV